MGCASSSNTAVHPLVKTGPWNQNGAGGKPSQRSDSAGSKGTKDSGVVMENRELQVSTGAVPDERPPESSDRLGEHEVHRVLPNDAAPRLPQGDLSGQGRPKSRDLMEELWTQGIIPVQSLTKEKGTAFCIMHESVTKSLPARLEPLKVKKSQNYSRKELDEKMRRAEERRKVKQNELKTRLTTRGRRLAPISNFEEDPDSALTLVELQPLPAISQFPEKRDVGGEWVKEAAGHSMERDEAEQNGKNRRSAAEERGESEDDLERSAEGGEMEEEEGTLVEELRPGELLSASGELDSDSSFQQEDNDDKIF
ncbi:PREDICTED: uncharacterized protein LOC107092447 [Cyprinodon variegatus]|uniref:uncharacterized protein LOC107092447 n=1 Tax=Cyprinodon variegatus TaxID=28743 RepID=UPI00074292B6|nr:PREDICTED: uncharacterized protein LOC107092447 [Cyprinodon variegatus]